MAGLFDNVGLIVFLHGLIRDMGQAKEGERLLYRLGVRPEERGLTLPSTLTMLAAAYQAQPRATFLT